MLAQRSHPTARALLLLALTSLVIASQVDAGLLDILRQDVDYKRVADDLFKLTPSDELKDNVEAAGKLLEETKPEKDNKVYRDLLVAFNTLEDTSDEKILCHAIRLGNLRGLAANMAAGGNLGPKKISPAIKRLNRIIIQQIISARDICFMHLAQKWWEHPAADKYFDDMLGRLDKYPRQFLLEDFPNLKSKELKNGDNDSMTCIEFMFPFNGKKEKKVLQPYVDLLIASNIIESDSKKLAKFYKDEAERPLLEPIHYFNKDLEINAFRFRACQLCEAVRVRFRGR